MLSYLRSPPATPKQVKNYISAAANESKRARNSVFAVAYFTQRAVAAAAAAVQLSFSSVSNSGGVRELLWHVGNHQFRRRRDSCARRTHLLRRKQRQTRDRARGRTHCSRLGNNWKIAWKSRLFFVLVVGRIMKAKSLEGRKEKSPYCSMRFLYN